MGSRGGWGRRPGQREDKIIELVDPWIRRAFSPANLRTTLQAMADAQHDDTDQHRRAAAREKINTCRTKLDRYRAALDAGTDPALVQQWITQVQAEKAVADADLRRITGRRIMTTDEINTLVEAMSGIATILRKADPTDKAEVYWQLGIKLTYKPGLRLIQAEASPSGSCTKVCPEIDTNQYPISADLGSRPHCRLNRCTSTPSPGRVSGHDQPSG